MRLYILFRSSCFQRWNILKDGNLCRLKIAIIRVTFMYFFFNSKIRILIEISIVSIHNHIFTSFNIYIEYIRR